MVPLIDMANHASGDDTTALYDTDADRNAILILYSNKRCLARQEVTITYGDEKGACEMLFSYGFIENTMISARELFLNLEIPADDPLRLAKMAVSRSAPGFRLFMEAGSIKWEGPFVWLLCINEEDGLEFRLLQTDDSERELKVFWKGFEIEDMSLLRSFLMAQPLWDVFNLRATAVLQARVETQLISLQSSRSDLHGEYSVDHRINPKIGLHAKKLKDLEETLMLQAYQDFEDQVSCIKLPCRRYPHY